MKNPHISFALIVFQLLYFFTINFAQNNTSAKATSTVVWQALTSSMKITSSMYSNLKPLQYHDELNVVSFIHPKSPTYIPSPMVTPSNAATNVIVAEISQNWGATWDSTCLWSSSTNMAFYPQGGIYSASGNTSIANAYLVGTGGVVTSPVGTNAGLWFGSKSIGPGNYTTSQSTVSNANQFMPNHVPFGAVGKVDFWQYHFTSTKDGLVRSIAPMVDDANASNPSFRGSKILTGNFASGTFNWTADTIIPPFLNHSINNRALANQTTYMAWNDSGTVGYAWFIGCKKGAIGANRGYQPIVYKTINSGVNWTIQPEINFPQSVLKHLALINPNSSLVIPYFNSKEGIDGIVDGNNNLHIASTLLSSANPFSDSLHITHTYTMSTDAEMGYSYQHVPGFRPYIYDFILKNTGWETVLVDSMSTEAPGAKFNEPGYNSNNWDVNFVNDPKLEYGARIQLSRTPDGKFIIYTWTDSDTIFTNGSKKWNESPNLNAKCYRLCDNRISWIKINLTNQSNSAINTNVVDKAHMHFTSPKSTLSYTRINTSDVGPGVYYGIKLPVIVSNSLPLKSLGNNTHWYSTADLEFGFDFICVATSNFNGDVGLNKINSFYVFPNPTNEILNFAYASTSISVTESELSIIDIYGRQVKKIKLTTSETQINISELSSGIYFVQLMQDGKIMGTEKIVKE